MSFLYDGGSWSVLQKPAAADTWASDIDGNKIAGTFVDAGGRQGFIYDGSSWLTFSSPDFTYTQIEGYDGTHVVGVSYDTAGGPNHGYVYDMGMGIMDFPGAESTLLNGIDGAMIVGTYWNTDRISHGLLYDGHIFHTLDFPGATETLINDISGNKIVGEYCGEWGNHHSFIATIVPEPSSWILFLSGLIGMWTYPNRKKKS